MSRNFVRRIQKFTATVALVALITISLPAGSLGQQRGTHTAKAREARGVEQPLGGSLFLPAVAYQSGGYESNWIAIGDVNGDGNADLLVADTSSCDGDCGDGLVGVLLGNGDGTFKSSVVQDAGPGAALSVAVADVNGDGKPDLVVANQAVSVLLGKGDGTFQSPVNYSLVGAGPIEPNSIVVADVNGDGKPDLLVSLYGASVDVLLGNGDGTFQTAMAYGPGCCGQGSVAVADINGDGKPDLIVTSGNSDVVGIMLGNGDGTFQSQVNYDSGGVVPTSVAVADVNGDGKFDLLVANAASAWSDGYPSGQGSASVLLGNGDGTFQTAVVYFSGGPNYHSIAAVDVNGDGKLDLLLAGCSDPTAWYCGGSSDGSVAVLLGNADGTFQPTVLYDSGGVGPVSIAVSDLNHGGLPAVAVANWAGSTGNPYIGTIGVLMNAISSRNSTTTTLTSSKNPGIYQQPVTFTAVVTSGSGTPTGTVVFFDGTATLASATLVNGSASFTTSNLKRGWAAMTASYLGAGSFDPSTSPVLYERVDKNGLFQTRIHLSSSNRNSYVGQPVTFTVSLAALRRGEIPQDGDQVQFFDGNNFIGDGTTQNGVASVTTSSLTARHHIIGAYFPGDDDFSHAYTQITQIVNKYGTSVRVTASPNPALYGQAITFTATVTSAGPNTPTGSVKFKDIGEATLSGGVATFVKNSLRAGTHAVTAEYLGDADSGESTSPVLDEVVNPASTTTTITSSVNPSSSGQTVTFTATVTSSTGLDPFGKVTFTAGGTTLGTVSLKDSVATVSTAALPVGTSTITATYNGAAGFTGSGASLTQTVNP
jgi:uncharacterized repeat protein (TIGR01451 family)